MRLSSREQHYEALLANANGDKLFIESWCSRWWTNPVERRTSLSCNRSSSKSNWWSLVLFFSYCAGWLVCNFRSIASHQSLNLLKSSKRSEAASTEHLGVECLTYTVLEALIVCRWSFLASWQSGEKDVLQSSRVPWKDHCIFRCLRGHYYLNHYIS